MRVESHDIAAELGRLGAALTQKDEIWLAGLSFLPGAQVPGTLVSGRIHQVTTDTELADFGDDRFFGCAHIHGVATAGPEMTATRRVHGGGDVALQHDPQSSSFRVHAGRRREKGLGIGMVGRAEEIADRSLLDDTPEVHHGHSVAEGVNEIEIMGDEQVGDTQSVLQVAQEVDYLHLSGDVQ
jgi:hypothetical protein